MTTCEFYRMINLILGGKAPPFREDKLLVYGHYSARSGSEL